MQISDFLKMNKKEAEKYLNTYEKDIANIITATMIFGSVDNFKNQMIEFWNEAHKNYKLQESISQQEQTITKEENPDSKTYSNKEIHKVVDKIDEILDVKQSESYKEESNNNQKKMAYKITERLRNNLRDALRENINKKGKVKNDKYIKDGTEVTIKDVVELTQQYVVTTDGSSMFYINHENVKMIEEKMWEDYVIQGWNEKFSHYKMTIKEDGKVNIVSKRIVDIELYLPELLEVITNKNNDEYVKEYILYAVSKNSLYKDRENIQKKIDELETLQDTIDIELDKLDETQNELYNKMHKEN